MIDRIPQRTQTDCAICVVAMVMGHLYTYERVMNDSMKYAKVAEDDKFYAWWEPYLRDEGFRAAYRPFLDVYSLPQFDGRIVGLVGMGLPHLKVGHIVAVDEIGIIDPANNAPDHMEIAEYVRSRKSQGANFHGEFLAVERRNEHLGSLPGRFS